MLVPEAYERIAWLRAEYFYRASHRLIFEAIQSLMHGSAHLDTLLVADKLGDKLGDIGGKEYLGALAAGTPSAANIVRYAEIVRDRWKLRTVIAVGMEMADSGYAPHADADSIAQSSEGRLYEMSAGTQNSELLAFHRTLDTALIWDQQDAVVPTGFIDLDRLIPLRAGELTIIAGRPSMGKSALALAIAEHLAWTQPVAFFSMEMSRANIGKRVLNWHRRLDDHPEDRLSNLLLFIETPSVLTVETLRMKVRRQKRLHGCALVVVDYLTMMRGRGENRTQEVGSISRGLKGVAIDCDVPLIAVAQLNRANEGRTDHRPLLSDLRESGDIEQDADIVAMVYRDEYYNPESEAKGTAEILVRKSRNGPVGTARLTWINDYARFENYAGGPIRNGSNVSSLNFTPKKR